MSCARCRSCSAAGRAATAPSRTDTSAVTRARSASCSTVSTPWMVRCSRPTPGKGLSSWPRAGAPGSSVAEEPGARHGDAVKAILVYGSCYRTGDEHGVFDIYVLIDGYRAFYGRWGPALANRVLSPNVYSLEVPSGPGAVRAKYAILTLAGFSRGTSRRAFHSYFWARFSQPAGLLFAADAAVAARVQAGLAGAV